MRLRLATATLATALAADCVAQPAPGAPDAPATPPPAEPAPATAVGPAPTSAMPARPSSTLSPATSRSAQRRAELAKEIDCPRQGPRHPQPVAARCRRSGAEARGGQRPHGAAPGALMSQEDQPARLAQPAARRAGRGSGRPAAGRPPSAAGHPGAPGGCAGLRAQRHPAGRRRARPADRPPNRSPPTCDRWWRCARSRSASATACAPTPRRCSKAARAYHFFLNRSAPHAPPRPRRWPTKRSGRRRSPTRRPACAT